MAFSRKKYDNDLDFSAFLTVQMWTRKVALRDTVGERLKLGDGDI